LSAVKLEVSLTAAQLRVLPMYR